MKLEDQVCSLELSKQLKELGVKQQSLLSWDLGEGDIWQLVMPMTFNSKNAFIKMTASMDAVSAYTVAELGEMLKKGKHMLIPVTINSEWHGVDLIKHDHIILGRMDEVSEADARAKMLIYLLENKLMEV